MQEIPIKVDLFDGADGIEILEVIESLRFQALNLRTSNPFRSDYLTKVAEKYELIFKQRQSQLLSHLQSIHPNW